MTHGHHPGHPDASRRLALAGRIYLASGLRQRQAHPYKQVDLAAENDAALEGYAMLYDLLSDVAPNILHALGMPGAIAATGLRVLSEVFCGERGRAADEITHAIREDDDVLAKLREADLKFVKEMRLLGIEWEKLKQQGLKDARAHNRASGDKWTPRVLAAGLLLGVLGVVSAGIVMDLTPEKIAYLSTIMSPLLVLLTQVFNFHFGSSRGSETKNDTIRQALIQNGNTQGLDLTMGLKK